MKDVRNCAGTYMHILKEDQLNVKADRSKTNRRRLQKFQSIFSKKKQNSTGNAGNDDKRTAKTEQRTMNYKGEGSMYLPLYKIKGGSL